MSASVFFLDDDPDLIFAYKETVEQNGLHAIVASSVLSMAGQETEVLSCDVAFLDIELGRDEPNGIDALAWLQVHEFDGRVYFLTGHGRRHHLVAMAAAKGEVETLTKPISSERLLGLIQGGPREYDA